MKRRRLAYSFWRSSTCMYIFITENVRIEFGYHLLLFVIIEYIIINTIIIKTLNVISYIAMRNAKCFDMRIAIFIIFCRYSPFYYYNTQCLFREKYIGEVFLHNFSLKTVLKILKYYVLVISIILYFFFYAL